MPKKRKTRQEKIIADLRRKLETIRNEGPVENLPVRQAPTQKPLIPSNPTTSNTHLPPPPKVSTAYGKTTSSAYREVTSPAYREVTSPAYREVTSSAYREVTSSAYLKQDLTKTFVLAILAFSLELVLYFWLG